MAKTLNDIYIEYKNILKSEIESRELCAYALNLDRTKNTDWGFLYLGDESEQKIKTIMDRRLGGEPVGYILGEWEFYSLPFKLNANVLVPRQDTETLVDNALEAIKSAERPRVLDLCTGSGCVGISIAHNSQNARIVACDISKDALDIARFNAKLNKVHHRFMAFEHDLFNDSKNLGSFDLIVSNPPYIPTSDIETLDIDVKNFEPKIALDGGDDGLNFYREICDKYRKNLNPNGILIFEYGIGQQEDIKKIMETYGFTDIKIHKDLCDINRTIQGTMSIFGKQEEV